MPMPLEPAALERFEHLFEPELIAEIGALGRLSFIPQETTIMEIGQTITHMPLVIEGAIKIMAVDEQGDELLLYHLELGDTCAMTLNCCSKKAKSTITAIAETDTRLIMVPVEQMEIWMVKYTSWRNFVLDSYQQRLNEMLEAVDALAFHDMRGRLEKYLRDKAMVLRESELRLTHAEVARDLHSSRVVVTRLLKKLEQDGLIRQRRNIIEVVEFA